MQFFFERFSKLYSIVVNKGQFKMWAIKQTKQNKKTKHTHTHKQKQIGLKNYYPLLFFSQISQFLSKFRNARKQAFCRLALQKWRGWAGSKERTVRVRVEAEEIVW